MKELTPLNFEWVLYILSEDNYVHNTVEELLFFDILIGHKEAPEWLPELYQVTAHVCGHD